MSRFSSVITLIKLIPQQNEEGSFTTLQEEREVFANPFNVGLNTWAAAQSFGLKPDAVYQVRSVDYQGEESAIVDGIEYSIERAMADGDFTKLTMKKRLDNGLKM